MKLLKGETNKYFKKGKSEKGLVHVIGFFRFLSLSHRKEEKGMGEGYYWLVLTD